MVLRILRCRDCGATLMHELKCGPHFKRCDDCRAKLNAAKCAQYFKEVTSQNDEWREKNKRRARAWRKRNKERIRKYDREQRPRLDAELFT